jgi:putative membrane protein
MTARNRDAEQGSAPAEPDRRGWLARRLFPDGSMPDPRFSLANERTFLSWIRTSLALLAGGIAVEAFGVVEDPYRKGVAILLLLLGMLISGGAFMRWIGVERAMRHQKPLPLPLIAPVLGIGAAMGALVVIVVIASS